MNNVLIKKQVSAFNNDAYNRTAVCASDIDNGCVFKLDSYSETEGEDMVWTATEAGAATATGLWMAASPEVVITKVGTLEFKGLVDDPRYFVNIAGKTIDAFLLAEKDIIEMTGEGITDIATADYLVPTTTGFKLVKASAAGTGTALKKVGTGILHVGTPSLAKTPVKTYKFEVVKN